MLILSGSSMSFMERQVLGYQSPLYGRRTAQIKVMPFDYRESRGFVPDMGKEDAAVVYGITGGIPQYLIQFDDGVSLEENLRWNVLDPSAYLFEEPASCCRRSCGSRLSTTTSSRPSRQGRAAASR